MRSQTSRKRGRNSESSVKENGMVAKTVTDKRQKTSHGLGRSHSPPSGHHNHGHHSPTGGCSSPTAVLIGPDCNGNGRPIQMASSQNGPALQQKATTNGSCLVGPDSVDRQPAVQPVNGFPVTRDAPAPGRLSRVADNGQSPSAATMLHQHQQQRKTSSAKSQCVSAPPHHRATQIKGPSATATGNHRSGQHHGTGKVHHSAKQQRNGHQQTAEDMVVVSALRRQQMKDAFQPWVMQTYGDAAKTKTIARRKAERIVKILRGEDRSNGADSSKFRFWVRAKGFRLGPSPSCTSQTVSDKSSSSCIKDRNNSTGSHVQASNEAEELFVVTSTTKDEFGDDRPVYKKVAVVEDFFDIIYREHVEFGGRTTGKHAGQKRTYRAITEIYAFLPREAVTRFLMQCAECQRRGSSGAGGVVSVSTAETSTTALLCASSPPSTLSPLTDCGVSPGSPTPPASPTWKPGSTSLHPAVPWCGAVVRDAWSSLSAALSPPSPSAPQSQLVGNGADTTQTLGPTSVGASSTSNWSPGSSSAPPLALPLDSIDLSLPLTTTLLKHAKLAGVPHQTLFGLDRAEACFATGAETESVNPFATNLKGMTAASRSSDDEISSVKSVSFPEISGNNVGVSKGSACVSIDIGLNANPPSGVMATVATAGLMASAAASAPQGAATPVPTVAPPFCAPLLSKDPASPITLDLSSKAEVMEDHSPGLRDDDEDDDDDVEDKMDNQVYDPERLKAFNMFVRLFVDENLDRKTPISRQPREKVQAIIDSCLRQFPEFGERARKRIRTYLKSCRRNKRSHREAIGSDAQNRPMPPHLTSAAAEQILAQACENENQNAKRLRMGLEPISQPLPAVSSERPAIDSSQAARPHSPTATQSAPLPAGSDSSPTFTHATPTASLTTTNLFRPAFGPYQRSTGPPATCATATINNSGATDLSMKPRLPAIQTSSNGVSSNSSTTTTNSRTSPLPHKLNAAEILAVRQLVTGYRESAAFLLRSADELEQLLLQQHASS